MITHIYGSSNASTRKAVKWFKDKNIPYVYRNIIGQGLIVKDVRHILSLTKNGTDDILSTKSHDYQNLNLSLADLSLENLCQFMIEFPNIVRTPIIFNDKKLQVGFNDSIRQFIPRKERQSMLQNMLLLDQN